MFWRALDKMFNFKVDLFAGIHIPSRPVLPEDYNFAWTIKITSPRISRWLPVVSSDNPDNYIQTDGSKYSNRVFSPQILNTSRVILYDSACVKF